MSLEGPNPQGLTDMILEELSPPNGMIIIVEGSLRDDDMIGTETLLLGTPIKPPMNPTGDPIIIGQKIGVSPLIIGVDIRTLTLRAAFRLPFSIDWAV